MKKIVALLVVFATLLLPMGVFSASLIINDASVELKADSMPIAEGETVLLPLRAIFEGIGASVAWDQETRTVFIVSGEDILVLQIGNETAVFNEAQVNINPAPQIINDRTFVPAGFIESQLGAEISVENGDIRLTINK